MGKIRLSLALGILGVILFSGSVFAQQIQTNTSVTTQGSTTFGYLPNGADLGVFMQTTVAPTCTTVSINVQTCTSDGGTAVGDNDNFVRVDQMPGSFTDSPIPGTVSALPNFACGQTASASNCLSTMNFSGAPAGAQAQSAPNFTGRQLVGNINTNIVIGDGGATAGMPDGFIAFTLDPVTADATVDQFITHTVSLGGGSLMDFEQRDVTIGADPLNPAGDRFIPDAAGGGIERGSLTLVPFTAFDTQDLPAFGTVPSPLNMVSRMTLAQGAADGFGALNLDAMVQFPGTGVPPFTGVFVTPGLNTGVDPNSFFVTPFGPEWNGFAFP